MKREFLKGFEGLSDEAIDKIMAENGKDIEAEKSKNTVLKTENETLKNDKKSLEDKITELTDSAKDEADYKKQLEDLQKSIKEKEEADKQAKADAELTDAIVASFGDKKFTSDYVKNGLIADMKAEIAKPENKGKGYAKIFDVLTKDKDGIFANPNPPADMPGMGRVEMDQITSVQFKRMGYKSRNELYGSNKELYDKLSRE